MSTEWMADGKCREIPSGNVLPARWRRVIIAQRICATCPVASQCLEYALENHVDHGIWAAAQNESVVASFANVAVGAYSTLTLPSAPSRVRVRAQHLPKVATTICSKPFAPRPVSHCATYTPISSTIVRSSPSSTIAMR